ncbi:MAG: hypothetical protein ABIO79_01015 [Ferruginibacter sp.]
MSVNLVETIQKKLGYPEIQKIDPNTQQPAGPEDKFSQAAVPAVLTGLYSYVQKDEGAEKILQVANSTMWVNKFFEADKNEVAQTISDYSNKPLDQVETEMNAIANEAIKTVKENLSADAGIKEVKDFFSDRRKDILLYLVPALNMGRLLHDETLDDNTNKMEGPVSSLMQNIGSAFSNPVTGEEINTAK